MFTAGGTFEIPYLEDLSFQPKYRGQDEISGFCQFVRDLYPGLEFENLRILIDTPDQVFAEYEFTAISSKTGRRIHQLIFGRLVSESGKIKCLREARNTAAVIRAVFPAGLSGIPAGAPLSDSP